MLSKKLSNAFNKLSPTVSFDGFGNPSFSLNVHKIDNQDIFDQLTKSQRVTLQAIAGEIDAGIFSESVRILYNLPVSSSLSVVLKALQKKGNPMN